MLSLDEALASLPAETASPAPSVVSPENLTESDRLEAMRAYVIGRSQRLAGELPKAEASLKQAARLDPSAPGVWRELGLAQSAMGNRSASASAFRRTLELDPDDIAALEALSRNAHDRRDPATAARLLAQMRDRRLSDYDPALPYLVSSRLGRALYELGYVTASVQAMRQALDLPDAFGDVTQFQNELGLLYRQRGDLWRDAGDSMMRLGKPDDAAQCYENAARLPNLNPSAMTPRRVYAAMKRGRPAEAASIIVGEIREADGRVDERLMSLLRYVASYSSVGPVAAESLASIAASVPESQRSSAWASLQRARAACLSDAEAIRVLREQLRAAPADDAALRDLISRLDRSKPDRVVDEVLRLIEASPLHEARYARAALAGQPDVSPLLASLDRLPPKQAAEPPAQLLRARLLEASGDLAGAERVLAGLLAGSPGMPAAVAAHTSLLWRLGRIEEARALVAMLSEGADPAIRDAKILALAELGEFDEASRLLAPLLPAASEATVRDVDRLLLSARIDLLSGEFDRAAGTLNLLMNLDPTRDEPYAALLNLYSRTGPLADDAKAVAIIRALRDSNPSSPTLRFLRAQEALQRGQLDLAERDLMDLAEESPVRPGVVEGLVRLWISLGQYARAEDWLRDQVARRHEESVFTIQLALFLDDRGRQSEGIALLEERLAMVPGDDNCSRALEALLREDPSQRERAQMLARARLARSPRTAEAMVELAEVSAAAGAFDEATEAVTRAAAPGRPLRADLTPRLARLVVELGADALRGRIRMDAVLGLQRAVIAAAPDSPPAVYLIGIRLLCRSGAPLNLIYDALEAAAEKHPARRAEFYVSAYDSLIAPGQADLPGAQRPAEALLLAERICTTTTPPPLALHTVWVIQVWLNPQAQDFSSLVRALGVARKSDTIDPLIEELVKSLRGADGRAPDPSEIAYELALRANTIDDRDSLVEWLYRVALRYDPEHLWANNNLGYSLLERDENIDEAVALIEVAYRSMLADPLADERAPITDSLGWARYKRGIMRDEIAEDGTVIREGAVTLLKRSYEMALTQPRYHEAMPVIGDHYADALWVAGDREQAIRIWEDSAERARKILDEVAKRGIPGAARVLAEIENAGAAAQRKVEAARADLPPPVARIHRPQAPADPPVPAGDAGGMIQ